MSSKQVPSLVSSFSLDLWISWAAAILIAAISATVFLYSTFETQSASDEKSAQMEKHLDRIESKVDSLLLKN